MVDRSSSLSAGEIRAGLGIILEHGLPSIHIDIGQYTIVVFFASFSLQAICWLSVMHRSLNVPMPD